MYVLRIVVKNTSSFENDSISSHIVYVKNIVSTLVEVKDEDKPEVTIELLDNQRISILGYENIVFIIYGYEGKIIETSNLNKFEDALISCITNSDILYDEEDEEDDLDALEEENKKED